MALDQLRERLFTLFSFYRIAHPNPRLNSTGNLHTAFTNRTFQPEEYCIYARETGAF